MDSNDAIQLISLFVLILLSAFFSSAETALISVNRIRVRTLAEENKKNALILSKLLDNTNKMLSAVLIGNNIVNLSAASISASLAIKFWGNSGAGIATGIITLLILIFGEITPKTISSQYSEKVALTYAPIISALMFLLTPVISIVNGVSGVLLRLFGVEGKVKLSAMTESELRTIVNVSHEDGLIESEERKIINNIFDFKDSQARDIMVPRVNMAMADIDSTYEDLLQQYRIEKFTRVPIYEDTSDNVIGIINIKDLLLYDTNQIFDVRNYLREPYYTYEYKKTSELLIEMRKSSINIAIVLDEYGATAGLITLEDLLEEIVGEIRDEYDTEEEDFVKALNEFEYIIEGSMNLEDINEMLGLALHSEDYDSIAGLMIELLDHLPEQGEEVVTHSKIRLLAEKVDKKRIQKVHLFLPRSDEQFEEQEVTADALD